MKANKEKKPKKRREPWVDLSDVLIAAGLASLGYGLHLYRPWVAFATIGAILFIMGAWGALTSGDISESS